MARKSISYYTFAPGNANAGTVTIPDVYQLKDILMITNVTRNAVIYNFSDSTRGAYTFTQNQTDTTSFPGTFNGTTTITLTANTAVALGYASTDVLQIFVESPEMRVRTHDFGIDAVERQRVAQPESLIDADFEYGLQKTKWADYTTVSSIPTTFEVPGTDFQANIYGYVTMMTADSSGNITAVGAGGTSMKLLNQGFTAAAPYVGNTSPIHNLFDYKIIINQPLAASHPVGTTFLANSVAIATGTNPTRHISAANGGIYQRTFTVGTTTGWQVGDIGVIVGLPFSDSALTSTSVMSSGSTQLVSNTAIPAGTIIAVQTDTTQIYELMAVNAGGGSTSLGVTRGLLGTNFQTGQQFAIAVGNRIKYITPSATATQTGNIEIFRVEQVDSVSSTLTVTRGWMNTNASPEFLPSSIVAKVNMAADLSPSLGGSANIEIVRTTAVAVGLNGTQTITRSQLGTTAISAAPAGSLVINAAGVFVAGNATVPLIGVNANSHGIASAMAGGGAFNIGGGATAWTGTGNANAYISTIGLNNANVEGVFFNTINDVHYAAYVPKNPPNRDIGYQLNPVTPYNDVVLRRGGAFTSANVPFMSIVSNGGSPSLMTITAIQPHGLYPGQLIQTALYGSDKANIVATGTFAISSTPNPYQFTFTAKGTASGFTVANSLTTDPQLGTISNIRGNIVLFPSSLVRHRPLDGGTNIGVNAPAFGYEVARTTKKYFRYQSGKGMMFTTGISLNPVFTVTNVIATGTSIGSTITITTDLDHGLQIGANIQLTGMSTSGFTTFYRVASVTAQNQFTVLATQVLGATTPTYGSFPQFSLLNWHGAKIRIGMFDDQNGVFWEYDGQKVYVGKQSATTDLLGRINIGTGQNLVVGDRNARFQDQLLAGDKVVIRGMTHHVAAVESQTSMYVTPAYRGVINAQDAKGAIVVQNLYPQEQFNQDKLDGTGPSGYLLDKSKMQMIAIQYTWYGAGFIDWGLRATDGKMVWAHRVKNNNQNTEAYMRSGNLPARYAVTNQTAYTGLRVPLVSNETGNISLSSVVGFPTANVTYPAHVIIDNEIIRYTAGPFTANGNICALTRAPGDYQQYNLGAIRSVTMGAAAAHTANTAVRLFSVTASPDLNHWGSAVILDGGFTRDRSYQFTYNLANVNVLGTQVQTLFMMRLAPSITNAITGDLGAKDVINRAQLLLQNMYVNIADTSASLKPRFLIQAVLNPTNLLAANWAPLNQRFNIGGGTNQTGGFNQPSFTQFVANVYPAGDKPTQLWGVNTIQWDTRIAGQHNGQPYAQGGEQLFSIPVSAQNSGFIDLQNIKEIGGAMIPGTGHYPNGNEIVAFNIVPAQGAQANVDIQITYVESQA